MIAAVVAWRVFHAVRQQSVAAGRDANWRLRSHRQPNAITIPAGNGPACTPVRGFAQVPALHTSDA